MPVKLLLVVGKHEAIWGDIIWFWEGFQNSCNFTIYEYDALFSATQIWRKKEIEYQVDIFKT